jgi:hypothetical protein
MVRQSTRPRSAETGVHRRDGGDDQHMARRYGRRRRKKAELGKACPSLRSAPRLLVGTNASPRLPKCRELQCLAFAACCLKRPISFCSSSLGARDVQDPKASGGLGCGPRGQSWFAAGLRISFWAEELRNVRAGGGLSLFDGRRGWKPICRDRLVHFPVNGKRYKTSALSRSFGGTTAKLGRSAGATRDVRDALITRDLPRGTKCRERFCMFPGEERSSCIP